MSNYKMLNNGQTPDKSNKFLTVSPQTAEHEPCGVWDINNYLGIDDYLCRWRFDTFKNKILKDDAGKLNLEPEGAPNPDVVLVSGADGNAIQATNLGGGIAMDDWYTPYDIIPAGLFSALSGGFTWTIMLKHSGLAYSSYPGPDLQFWIHSYGFFIRLTPTYSTYTGPGFSCTAYVYGIDGYYKSTGWYRFYVTQGDWTRVTFAIQCLPKDKRFRIYVGENILVNLDSVGPDAIYFPPSTYPHFSFSVGAALSPSQVPTMTADDMRLYRFCLTTSQVIELINLF